MHDLLILPGVPRHREQRRLMLQCPQIDVGPTHIYGTRISPPCGTTGAENNVLGLHAGEKANEVEDARVEERRSVRWKARPTRAVASSRRGIYDVISSLTVNNFPRGCGRHCLLSRAFATMPSSRRRVLARERTPFLSFAI